MNVWALLVREWVDVCRRDAEQLLLQVQRKWWQSEPDAWVASVGERWFRDSALVNLMVNQTCRSVVLCVIVLEVFVTRTVFRTRFAATVVQGLLLGFGQNRASRFSVQNELIFCLSSVHTKSLSTIYNRDSFDKRRHQHDAWFLWFDRFLCLPVRSLFCVHLSGRSEIHRTGSARVPVFLRWIMTRRGYEAQK